MAQFIKMNRNQIRKLTKFIKTINELLNIENTSKIKNTIQKLKLKHDYKNNLEFDYGKNFIRIYSLNCEWQVYDYYDDIYFNLILDDDNNIKFESNCKTPFEYVPKVVKNRIRKGLKYIIDNSKDYIRKINLIVDEDRRNIAMNEFFPKRYVKI